MHRNHALKIAILMLLVGFMTALDSLAAGEKVGWRLPFHFQRADSYTQQQADSIMQEVRSSAVTYESAVQKYEAEIYIKGRTKILKENFLMRFAHHLYPVDWKNKDLFFEMVSRSRFDAPNRFLHTIETINGNSVPNRAKQQEVMTYLNLNVYSETAYNEALIMPLAKNADKYYRFNLESTEDTAGLRIFKIRFLPRQWSQKLVAGDLYVIDKQWTIDKIDLHGKFDFAEFNLIMSYSRNYRRFIIPEKADLYLRYNTLGNRIATTYHSTFKYREVEWVEEDYEPEQKKPLDLTRYFKLSRDTIPVCTDSNYWKTKRDVPLTAEEQQLLRGGAVSGNRQTPTDSATVHYIRLTRRLTNTVSLDYDQTMRIKYSGLLNPFQLGYSARNGITYKQQFRLSKTFNRDRQLRFRPEIGYVFKRKQVFFKIGADWEYQPARLGTFSLLIANGNQGYSSEILKEINEQLKDSTFQIDKLNLQYFKHYYIDLRHRIELFNGFQCFSGLSFHRRMPVKNRSNVDPGSSVEQLVNSRYDDFIADIGFSYTPRQYFRMDGYRKEYVYSHYPTFSIHFARAIPHVWKSTGNYARIEADMHQNISLGLTRRLSYHLSGGTYTRQKSTYFAEFEYFARRNFPESWNDHIGGVFNLLNGIWYNAADRYVQAHFMYQSPFILFQLMKPRASRYTSRYILAERFYLSQLWTPVLPSYTEVGYGLGNHIVNVALFAAFDRWSYQSMGFKVAFELFQ